MAMTRVAAAREGRSGQTLRCVFGLEKFLLADVVFAAVPVTIENRRYFRAGVIRQEQISRDDVAREIIEFEFFENVIAAVFARQRMDIEEQQNAAGRSYPAVSRVVCGFFRLHSFFQAWRLDGRTNSGAMADLSCRASGTRQARWIGP